MIRISISAEYSIAAANGTEKYDETDIELHSSSNDGHVCLAFKAIGDQVITMTVSIDDLRNLADIVEMGYYQKHKVVGPKKSQDFLDELL